MPDRREIEVTVEGGHKIVMLEPTPETKAQLEQDQLLYGTSFVDTLGTRVDPRSVMVESTITLHLTRAEAQALIDAAFDEAPLSRTIELADAAIVKLQEALDA